VKKLLIRKSSPLKGIIEVSGSKNSALPIMAASLLLNDKCLLKNIPNLADVNSMINLLESLGAKINKKKSYITINCSNLKNHKAEYNLVKKMRASILVLGPLLSRNQNAIVSLPGGCAIGTRPINYHLYGLKKLGAKISIKDGYVIAKAPNGLRGNTIELPRVSVGATENLLLASILAKGKTVIKNAAKEPEVQDLCNFLNMMGANIKGIGKKNIIIKGVKKLKSVKYSIIPDRIEAGTFIVAALITKGKLRINNIIIEHLQTPLKVLKKMGAKIKIQKNYIIVDGKNSQLFSSKIKTKPYPGFPTDLQAQFMCLFSLIKGKSYIEESVFENRFMHVSELNRLGAKIFVKNQNCKIEGVEKLIGAQIMASDLRASVSLVLAGLVANGETQIDRIYHLDRGYEKIENKLNPCGANIKRID